jgi:hypothetical protein
MESSVNTDKRPVLIGMNNPVSSNPAHALYPHPVGCTGHRLFEMLQSRIPTCKRHEYLSAFDRRNVVPHRVWDKQTAVEGAHKLEQEFWGSGRTIVLLGADTVAAFGIPRLLVHPQIIGGSTWRQIPHPSGRNLWYNDEQNKLLVSMLLEDLFNVTG